MTVDARTIQRCEVTLDAGPMARGIHVDKATGDVVFPAVAVDKNARPNRKGLIFDWDSPDDVKVDAWQANPVLLYQHDDFMIPIGWVEEIGKNMQRVTARCRIPDLSRDADMADYDREVVAPVRGAVRNGLLKAVSIGFYILRSEDVQLPDGGVAVKVKALEIVELSVCSLGAHETALIQHKAAADAPSAQAFAQRLGGDWRREDADGRTLYRLTVKDRPAQTPRPAQDDTDAQARLAHHRAERVEERGLKVAMAKVLGARGGLKGVDAPSVYAHLAAHYEELGLKPPPWRDGCTSDELNAMHDEGAIIIPGRPTRQGQCADPALMKRIEQALRTNPVFHRRLSELLEPAPDERAGTPDVTDPERATPAPPAPGRATREQLGAQTEGALRLVEAAIGQAVDGALKDEAALLDFIRSSVDSAITNYANQRRTNRGC